MALDQVPPDVAAKVNEFAAMVATRQPAAATAAMIEWIGVSTSDAEEETRTRHFATAATTLVAARVQVGMDQQPDDYWVLRPETASSRSAQDAQVHDVAMCQVVVRIANDEPEVAQDLLNAHHHTHGVGGLFWLAVCAVRMLANLLTDDDETRIS